MAIDREHIEGAKKALNKLPERKPRRLTQKDLVASLIDEIQDRMKEGYSLSDIHEAINSALPDDSKMKENSFKRALQEARKDLKQQPVRRRKSNLKYHDEDTKYPPSQSTSGRKKTLRNDSQKRAVGKPARTSKTTGERAFRDQEDL